MSEGNTNHIQRLLAVMVFVLVLGAGVSFSAQNNGANPAEASAASHNVSGFAWNGDDMGDGDPLTKGGIGWISFNCEDSSGTGAVNTCLTGADYGVNIAPISDPNAGLFSGYASAGANDPTNPGFGWVSFNNGAISGTNDLEDCPGAVNGASPNCEARVDLVNADTNGNFPVTGWARFCMHSAGAPNGCTGAGPGDIGWISLGGTDALGANRYGLAITPAGKFVGWDGFPQNAFAWSPEYGWIDFNPLAKGLFFAGMPLSVTLNAFNVGTNVSNTNPLYGDPFDLKWTVLGGATSCIADSTDNQWTGNKVVTGNTKETINSILSPVKYTLTCHKNAETAVDSVTVTPLAFTLSATPASIPYDLKVNGASAISNVYPTYTVKVQNKGNFDKNTLIKIVADVTSAGCLDVTQNSPLPSTVVNIKANDIDSQVYKFAVGTRSVQGKCTIKFTGSDGIGNSSTATVDLDMSGINKNKPNAKYNDI